MAINWQHTIKELRRVANLTQPKLAVELGCPQTTLSELERGNTKDPRHELGEKIISLAEKHGIAAREAAQPHATQEGT